MVQKDQLILVLRDHDWWPLQRNHVFLFEPGFEIYISLLVNWQSITFKVPTASAFLLGKKQTITMNDGTVMEKFCFQFITIIVCFVSQLSFNTFERPNIGFNMLLMLIIQKPFHRQINDISKFDYFSIEVAIKFCNCKQLYWIFCNEFRKRAPAKGR